MEKDSTFNVLYEKYGKTSDEDIRKYLTYIKIVRKEHKGINTLYGYYPLNEESVKKISEKLRTVSLSFDVTETEDTPVMGLVEYKTILFLVKSTSRFFLKPDVGEIFDQIDAEDLKEKKFKSICIESGHKTVDGTGGEHFLLTATLLK